MILPERTRPEGCITDLGFDAWFAAESSPEEAQALELHLAGCARCAARRAELSAGRASFLQAAPGLARKPRAARWPVAAFAGVLAAAAALLLVVRPGEPGARTKGSERIGFFVKRGEQVVRGHSGQRVMAGDQLRFAYSAPRSRYLAILSLDGAARASVYFPAGELAAEVPAGSDQALPAAVELDGVLGPEHVLALFCAAPLELEPLRQRLGRERGTFRAPEGCELRDLVLEKVPPSP